MEPANDTALGYEFFALTDRGRSRANNEDSVVADPDAALAVLADGMGGYNAGEVASGMATGYLGSQLGAWLVEASPEVSDQEVRRAMDICVDNANRAIFDAANANPQYAGMGTTLVLAVFRGSRLLLGHIGDSRGYRWREGRLVQLTRDHSLLQEQMDAGLISPEQAAISLNKNLVTRAMGVEDVVLLEAHSHALAIDDWVLLCSDGLSDMLDDDAIARVLQGRVDVADAAQALVDAANEAGGRDNIAVILVAVRAGTSAGRAWWPFRR
ncbi:MAG: Stp1/IreP family PP2C-type Ser/Thr phosphatase [Leptothrix sp. (in: b-proteobacteria)]